MAPNKAFYLTGAAFLFRAAQRPCSGPGKLTCAFKLTFALNETFGGCLFSSPVSGAAR
jgi:hypothetical protein